MSEDGVESPDSTGPAGTGLPKAYTIVYKLSIVEVYTIPEPSYTFKVPEILGALRTYSFNPAWRAPSPRGLVFGHRAAAFLLSSCVGLAAPPQQIKGAQPKD